MWCYLNASRSQNDRVKANRTKKKFVHSGYFSLPSTCRLCNSIFDKNQCNNLYSKKNRGLHCRGVKRKVLLSQRQGRKEGRAWVRRCFQKTLNIQIMSQIGLTFVIVLVLRKQQVSGKKVHCPRQILDHLRLMPLKIHCEKASLVSAQKCRNLLVSSCTGTLIAKDKELNSKIRFTFCWTQKKLPILACLSLCTNNSLSLS